MPTMPTDVLAYVRHYLWAHTHFPTTLLSPHSGNVSPALLKLWVDALCYAA